MFHAIKLTKHVFLIISVTETSPRSSTLYRQTHKTCSVMAPGRLSIADEIYKTTVPLWDGAISFQALVSGSFSACSRCRYRIVRSFEGSTRYRVRSTRCGYRIHNSRSRIGTLIRSAGFDAKVLNCR